MSKRSKLLKSQNGFSLVEVMVALAVLAGIATGAMSLFQNMNKNSLKGKQDSDMLLATNEIAALLADPENCKATFANFSTPPSDIKLVHPTSGIISKYPVGSQFGNVGTKLASYSLIYPLNGDNEQARLIIKYEKKKALGQGDFTRKLDLYVLAGAAPTYSTINCRSVAMNDELWKRGTGTWANDIYYMGSAGVGTTQPDAKLHVKDDGTKPGITVDSDGQSSIFIRGFSDSGNTYSALYLGKDANTVQQASWGWAFKKNAFTGNPEGLMLFHWLNGHMDAVLNVTPQNRLGLNTEAPLGDMHIQSYPLTPPAVYPMTLVVDNPNWQSSILLRGKSDNDLTHAAIYFGNETTTTTADQPWFVAHYGIAQAPAKGFAIGRNGYGNAISISEHADHIGLGVNAPSTAHKVDIGGDLKVRGNVEVDNTITAYSDRRLKKNISPLDDALEKILSLRGVIYQWKDKNRGEGPQIGFIAQELEKVYPELVRTGKNGMKSVAYQNLVAPLVEAIKEQQTEIESLKKQLEETNKKQQLMESELCRNNSSYSFCK